METSGEIIRILHPTSVFESFFDTLVTIGDDKHFGFCWKTILFEPFAYTRNESIRF
jgi:hypothetical protein